MTIRFININFLTDEPDASIGLFFLQPLSCWSRITDAFIDLQSSLAKNPNAILDYFEDLAHWKEVFRSAVYLLLTAVADTLFRLKIIIQATTNLLLSSPLYCFAQVSLFTPILAKWARAFFTISLGQNILTTFLIIFRIIRASNGVAGLKNHSLWPVVAILLESGTIYSSALFVLLITYVSGSYAQYIAIDMLVPIIGITFNLIIVRVGLGISHNPTANSLMNTTHPVFNKIPLQKFTIDVSQHIQTSPELDSTLIPKSSVVEDDAFSQGQGGEWKTNVADGISDV
ncbi:hypothetical protein Clacol_005415 [Clathrus columnatus]|uniref:Uncharacterized protein n=1 Tax=Clathrus columnatus TaxID=1419009 RepID=A0AAV5ADI0_9AGAM|nr:hypothetical protein Clacol_005415 [Clathrus columnatus]